MSVQRRELPDEINDVSKVILDTCFFIHTKLGPGLLESVYERALCHFLIQKNLKVERQKTLNIQIDDFQIPAGLKLDLVVNDKIIIELKSTDRILPIHEAQLHTYLKLSGIELGLLLNFNVKSFKDGIKRIIRTY